MFFVFLFLSIATGLYIYLIFDDITFVSSIYGVFNLLLSSKMKEGVFFIFNLKLLSMIRIGFYTGVIDSIVLEEKIGVSVCSKSGFVI